MQRSRLKKQDWYFRSNHASDAHAKETVKKKCYKYFDDTYIISVLKRFVDVGVHVVMI